MPIPKCPDAPALTGLDSNNIELKVHLVTPMFGGGVVARKVDETHLIRETIISSQLQFWWRATACAKHDNSNASNSINLDYNQYNSSFAFLTKVHKS